MKTLFITMVLVSASLFAAVPRTMNYQGKLTDASGVAVAGSMSVVFNIYDAATGGNLKWEEDWDGVGGHRVYVVNGLFDVQLGTNGSPIDTLSFSESYWIEMVVGGETMSPREKLAPVSFAYRSIYADTADYADTAGYAETSSSGGGVNLNVYKSDGTTKLGLYLGCFSGNNNCGFHCGWAYTLSTGGIHKVSSSDYRSAYGHARLYYSGADCTGTAFVPSGGGYRGGSNEDCYTIALATDSTAYYVGNTGSYGTMTYNSYRDYGYSCVNGAGTIAVSAYLYKKVCEEPGCDFLCGDSPCIIKP